MHAKNHGPGHADELEALRAEIAELKSSAAEHAHELGRNGVRTARTAVRAAQAVAGRALDNGRAYARQAVDKGQGVIVARPLTSVAVAAAAGAALGGIGVLLLVRRRD